MPPDGPAASATAQTLSVDLRRLPWASKLYRDYTTDFGRLETFYSGSPTDKVNWTNILDKRQTMPPATKIASILSTQLAGRGAPATSLKAAKSLAEPGSVAIVTGQQAGLFGGPLFTLLKAVTAIKLARQVADEHNTNVVPIFWIDAEDHDLDEICKCQLLDKDLELKSVTLNTAVKRRTTASSVRLDASIHETLDGLNGLLTRTEFTSQLLADLESIYTEGTRLVDAFALWLDKLVGPAGLVVFDASDPAVKPLVQSVFANELKMPGETNRQATVSGSALVSLGYHSQVTPTENATALFHIDDTRQSIHLNGDKFLIEDRAIEASALLEETNSHPEHFSPNVLLRPIIQDALFPTVAYVAGPSELAYFGQLRKVYERFKIPMPLVYPRASATLVDRAMLKFLDRHRLDFEELQPRDDSAINRLLASQLPAEIDVALNATDASINEQLSVIQSAVSTIDQTLTGVVQSTRNRMKRDLGTLKNKILQGAKRREETMRRQYDRARIQSFPGGQPQERNLSTVYFVNRYGPIFIERLIAELPIDSGRHWLINI